MLDATCIQALDRFQCEIGRRILKLSKHHPSDAVRIALNWPTISTRILLRKLTFLSRLLTNSDDTMSSRIFTSLAIVDVYSITIVQQCRLLEAPLGTNIIYKCLENPENAMITVRSNKKLLLDRDFELLLLSGVSSLSVQPIANIAQKVSWKKLWDNALDYGYKGTKCVQAILCELCRPTFGDRLCHLCSGHVECFSIHLCTDHPSLVCHHYGSPQGSSIAIYHCNHFHSGSMISILFYHCNWKFQKFPFYSLHFHSNLFNSFCSKVHVE